MIGPRVFRKGDPPPDDSVRAVLDRESRVWPRVEGTDEWRCTGGDRWPWGYVLAFGPLVECQPLPNYEAAVAADAARRERPKHCQRCNGLGVEPGTLSRYQTSRCIKCGGGR